jgi:hypothetical protein
MCVHVLRERAAQNAQLCLRFEIMNRLVSRVVARRLLIASSSSSSSCRASTNTGRIALQHCCTLRSFASTSVAATSPSRLDNSTIDDDKPSNNVDQTKKMDQKTAKWSLTAWREHVDALRLLNEQKDDVAVASSVYQRTISNIRSQARYLITKKAPLSVLEEFKNKCNTRFCVLLSLYFFNNIIIIILLLLLLYF